MIFLSLSPASRVKSTSTRFIEKLVCRATMGTCTTYTWHNEDKQICDHNRSCMDKKMPIVEPKRFVPPTAQILRFLVHLLQ